MSDYIKREDAIEAILNLTMSEGRVPVDTVTHVIKDVPSVDLPTKVIATVEFDGDKLQDIVNNTLSRNDIVQVVRCKDCRYWRSDGECIMHSNYALNIIYGVNENDYCSYGERKDGESE